MACNQATWAQPQRPNILILFADDLGWADLGCYGSTFYETPVLDSLAATGIKFTHGYSTSPVCSPARASLMTGKYPVKTGITDWIPGRHANGKARPYEKLIGPATALELSLKETSLAQVASNAGYSTFFAGKWHLGETDSHWPEHFGFHTNIGGWSKGAPYGFKNDTTGGFFTPYANPRLSDGPPGEYLTDRLTAESIHYLDTLPREKPFFMLYSLYAVHNPMQAPAALVNKYKAKATGMMAPSETPFVKNEAWMDKEQGWRQRIIQNHTVYAAMVENMDTNIGRLLAALRQRGRLDNTLIIFTSDNGGLSTAEGSPTVNSYLRAGKGWLYEGGVRVPFIVHWANGRLSGITSDIPITTADIFPTIVQAIQPDKSLVKEVDGANIFELLSRGEVAKTRTLYWHYPHYSNQGGRPGASIREGKWKLIYNYEDESIELYDLFQDKTEKHNQAGFYPDLSTEMKKKLLQWLILNNASSPGINPEFSKLVN